MTDYNDLWELDRGDYVSIITELRAELAEARADVQRFEAALDVSQRELAEARKDIATLARSYLKPYARALKQDPDDGGYAATIIEFAGCYSEGETIDEALANIEEAATGWMLAALSMGQTIPEPMKYRRTIRALVVAARAAVRVVYALAQGCFVSKDECINALRAQMMHAQQAENTAQFRAYLMGKNPGYIKQAERQGKE